MNEKDNNGGRKLTPEQVKILSSLMEMAEEMGLEGEKRAAGYVSADQENRPSVSSEKNDDVSKTEPASPAAKTGVQDLAKPVRLAQRIFSVFGIVVAVIVIQQLMYWNIFSFAPHDLSEFGVERVLSGADMNGNGIDDYDDMVTGAREYVNTHPKYKDKYYDGGYPPKGEGVCTDVIWAAFDAAGYDLKAMVDSDIALSPEAYPEVTVPDPNIDFRRVKNLKVFFERHAESLTTDPDDIAAWQPGDIVVYNHHIAIISDKRDGGGRAWIIHHGGCPKYEEDALTRMTIIAHYRWKTSA